MPNPKLLILTDWFYPGYRAGGPIRSCVNLTIALQNSYDVFVLTGNRDFGKSSPYPTIQPMQWTQFDERIQVCYVDTQVEKLQALKKLIKFVGPDILYLNSMFSWKFTIYPLLLYKLKLLHLPKVVLAPRGMLRSSALQFKSNKKKLFLSIARLIALFRMVHFHATDQQEEKDIRIQLGVREKQITLVPNLPQMKQGPFTEIVKKKNQIKIIFLARIHPIKNLHLLLQVLSNIQSKYSIHLNIYGVIEDSQYWEQKCLPVINTLPDNISVSSPKEIPHDKVHNLMTQNHLFALLTSGENFGHSIFESFLAGRPVLISDQTPWTNLEEKGIGLSLPLNNIDAFTQAIETFAVMDQEAFDLYAKRAWQFADEYVNDPELVQGYQKMFS